MRRIYIGLLCALLSGCLITRSNVTVIENYNDNVFLGTSEGNVGIWMNRYKNGDSLLQFSSLILREPDSVLQVNSNYVLAMKKNIYCLIYSDSLSNGLYLKTRSKQKIDDLIIRNDN